ncbi:hypothetical protein BDR03DRAFT_964253 [Suillus americanus]|nr:hypothetical protein BDR03DRAFT_964253 [Suillus americanus]
MSGLGLFILYAPTTLQNEDVHVTHRCEQLLFPSESRAYIPFHFLTLCSDSTIPFPCPFISTFTISICSSC